MNHPAEAQMNYPAQYRLERDSYHSSIGIQSADCIFDNSASFHRKNVGQYIGHCAIYMKSTDCSHCGRCRDK